MNAWFYLACVVVGLVAAFAFAGMLIAVFFMRHIIFKQKKTERELDVYEKTFGPRETWGVRKAKNND